MNPKSRNIKIIILSLLLGTILGSVIGDILGALLPQSVIKDFLLLTWDSSSFGFKEPMVLDFNVIVLTLGFILRVNVIGLIGIGISYYLLRYYRA
jgi:uncharacterized membrane protein